MFVALWVTLFTDAKIFGIWRDQRRAFRQLPHEKRRRVNRQMTVTCVAVAAYYALLITAPLGTRDTIVFFVVVPFAVVVPLGVIAAGIYGFRSRKRRPPPGRPT
jgi:hypothetical protein